MSKTPNLKMIGIFTFLGLAALAAFMSFFIGARLMPADDELIVAYFDESIRGLDVGSPVVLRGVELGRVARIEVIADLDNLDFSIPVFIKMHPDRAIRFKGEKDDGKIDHVLFSSRLIEKGLRARLALRSIITGQLMIELVMLPGSKKIMRGNGRHFEIPSAYSSLSEFSRNLQDLPIRETFDKLGRLLDTGAELSADISGTLANADLTLGEIARAAGSLKNFADYIERHPEAIIRGKKGEY